MPNKDPKKRAQQQASWRDRSYTPEYMRWLGARRALKIEKGGVFQALLSDIAADDVDDVVESATRAMIWASDREREVGNRFDHEKNEPYYQEGWKESK